MQAFPQLWRYVIWSLKHDSSLIEGQPGSVIVHTFTDIDNQIAAFCTAFAKLRHNFDSRLLLTTALFMLQTASSVEMMGVSIHLQKSFIVSRCLPRHQVLKPEDMGEYSRTPCPDNTRHKVFNNIME